MQRAATNEIRSNLNNQAVTIQNSGQSSSLANYPMDIANTLIAQNLQCLENYQSSLIDLPPSIDKIYASGNHDNDMVNLGSRFNQLQASHIHSTMP